MTKKHERMIPAPRSLEAVPIEIGGERFVVLSYPLERDEDSAKLTPAEHEVLERVAAGDSNAEIARRRGTSSQTIANQLRSIFRKLGVRSRAQLRRSEEGE